MGLVVVTNVVKELISFKALTGRLGPQYVLKLYHLTKRFGRVAYVLLEKSPQLPRADSRIQIGHYVQHT